MKFETFKGDNSKFYFHLVDDSGKVLLFSKGYMQKESAMAEIELIRNNFTLSLFIEKKVTESGLHFFNLKSNNGQVVGTSPVFDTFEIMGRWIWKIKKEVSKTKILETMR